jgi:hypothetical protein
MRVGLRIAFAIIAVGPLIFLQGRPDLAPAWLSDDVANVPAVVWLAMLWFAMFIVAAWIPVQGADER